MNGSTLLRSMRMALSTECTTRWAYSLASCSTMNREGQAVIGMRCIVCARVDGDDEHEAHIEPLAEARVRMMQKNWLLMRRGRVEDVKDFDHFVESCLRQDRRVHDE